MKRLRTCVRATVFLIALLLFSSHIGAVISTYADTADRKTVRVGYFIGEGFQEISPVDGRRTGYCYEYFQTLSYYTGWQYEYIETSWAGALEKIANGEIDILAQVSKTEERQEFMLYADRPMGAEDYYLYVLPDGDRPLRADDITTLNNARIGVNAGSYQLQTFIEWCEQNNVTCEIIESEDEEQRTEDFFNGKLDAIVDNDFYLDQGWIPLYKTGSSDYYLCVSKSRPDLLDDLNKAQDKLFEDSPLYIQKLQAAYFPHNTVSTSLKSNELEWIERRLNAHKAIKLGYISDYLPFCGLNRDTGLPEGVITLFVDNLRDNFGIEVECISYDSKEALYSAVLADEIDACFPLYENLWQSEELGLMQTDAFIEFPVAHIFRKNEYDEINKQKKFAVCKTGQMQSAYIRDKYPEAEIVYYDSYDECMAAIANGDVDGMYMSSYIMSRFIETYQEHSNLDVLYMNKNANLSLGVNINDCPELLTIFNKNIMLLDDYVKTSYLVRNTQTDPRYTITNFIKKYAHIIIIGVLIFSIVIIGSFWYQLRRVSAARQREKEAREAANRANRSKTDFLSSMSHDLRTPMNAIVGMTAIATANIDNSEKVGHCLSEITASSKHLLGLINDILDMNKIESGKVSLNETRFDLGGLINDIALIVKPLANERDHTFDLNADGIEHRIVMGDPERLHQCLVNFLSNSVKYTPNGGKISLSVSEKETENAGIGRYIFVITDNGIGMSEEFIRVMFDPFTRAEHTHVEGQQGTGLGMSITRNIVKLMKGEINVKSEQNNGTTITLTVCLPYNDADGDTAIHDTAYKDNDIQRYREENFSGVNVLLAEDNELNAEIAEEILKMTGMNVEHARNGREAVDKLNASKDYYYSLILMDIQMPVMDGYEATKEIRASGREYARNIPIIAMSANAFSEDIAKSKSVGMNDHIAKPLNLNKLLRTLKKYISSNSGAQSR